MSGLVWITWERQIRNRSLSQKLGAELCEIIVSASRFKRYTKSIIMTLSVIRSKRPSVVIGQNPSIVLSYLLLILSRFYKYSFVSDAHYGGIEACNRIPFYQKVLDILNASADMVIVTNRAHDEFIRSLGGKTFICQDPLPTLPVPRKLERVDPEKTIFFICSFDIDEQYKEVFEAAKLLREKGYTFYVSGNYKRVGIDPASHPEIKFLGYIPEEDFYSYLQACAAAIDLTAKDNCLVCGAYETISACKPLILSDTNALREYFGGAAIFTTGSPEDIARCMEIACSNKKELSRKAREWKERNETHMHSRIKLLRSMLLEKGKRAIY